MAIHDIAVSIRWDAVFGFVVESEYVRPLEKFQRSANDSDLG